MHRLIDVLGLAALIASSGSAGARSVDAPRIVPWTQIGGVRLGDERSVATALYGAPTKTFRERTPIGTRWYGHRVLSYRYTVPGGVVWVTAVDGRVRALGTSSSRYRTPGGIHVGLTTPRPVPRERGRPVRLPVARVQLGGVPWRMAGVQTRLGHLACDEERFRTQRTREPRRLHRVRRSVGDAALLLGGARQQIGVEQRAERLGLE